MNKPVKLCALSGCDKPARRKFCSNDHKDKYHNRNNPRGYGAQRFSQDDMDDVDDNIGHIFESGFFGHGQE